MLTATTQETASSEASPSAKPQDDKQSFQKNVDRTRDQSNGGETTIIGYIEKTRFLPPLRPLQSGLLW